MKPPKKLMIKKEYKNFSELLGADVGVDEYGKYIALDVKDALTLSSAKKLNKWLIKAIKYIESKA